MASLHASLGLDDPQAQRTLRTVIDREVHLQRLSLNEFALVVSNDTVQNFVFLNQGDGTFEEGGMASGLAFDNSGKATGAMGLDAAAYNNDSELAIAGSTPRRSRAAVSTIIKSQR